MLYLIFLFYNVIFVCKLFLAMEKQKRTTMTYQTIFLATNRGMDEDRKLPTYRRTLSLIFTTILHNSCYSYFRFSIMI